MHKNLCISEKPLIFDISFNKRPEPQPGPKKSNGDRIMTLNTFSPSETLVSFEIRRGGSHNNQGYLSFLELDKNIDHFIQFYELFVRFENYDDVINKFVEENPDADVDVVREIIFEMEGKGVNIEELEGLKSKLRTHGINPDELGALEYVTSDHNSVGLKVDNDGTGRIERDGEYDTTYVCRLSECSERELNVIYRDAINEKKPGVWVTDEVRAYVVDQLGIEEEIQG